MPKYALIYIKKYIKKKIQNEDYNFELFNTKFYKYLISYVIKIIKTN